MLKVPKVLIELAVDVVIILVSAVKDILEKKKERKHHGTKGCRRSSRGFRG